jgi:Glycosyltransferase family 87
MPWINPSRIRFVCVSLLLTSFVLLVLSLAISKRGRTIFGPPVGGDFVEFYVAGAILNGPVPERLYDLPLQDKMSRAVLERDSDQLVYAYAPFFAPIFRPLAMLRFEWAAAAWVAISVVLYASGSWILWINRRSIPSEWKQSAFLLMLAYEPFLVECLQGGQMAAFGFFWMALAMAWRDRPLRSGLALSVCLYKPTLVPLLVLMLLIDRRWRMLLGFAIGAAVVAAVSLWVVGLTGCLDYFRLLTSYTKLLSGSKVVFRTFKYIDITSFFRLLMPAWPMVARIVAIVCSLAAGGWMASVWIRSSRRGFGNFSLCWAATLMFIPAFSLYCPIYDATIAVPGAFVAADVLFDRRRAALPVRLQWLLASLFVVGWVTQISARAIGLQVLTLTLVAAGFYLGAMALAYRDPDPDKTP